MTRILLALLFLISPAAHAGIFEVSLGLWFNQSKFGNESFSWNRRYGLGAGYHFNEHSGIELSYQDSVTKTIVNSDQGLRLQDTKHFDQVYSASWVQHIIGKQFDFQPYFKAGVAQLNRRIDGTIGGIQPRVKREDRLTIVFSLGFRYLVTRRIAFRAEGTTYISEGGLSSWNDNIGGTLGLSVFF